MKSLIAALIIAATPAISQEECGSTEVFYDALADGYGESRAFAGMVSSNVVIEVWVNSETGTWSIIGTRPDGISCGIASGEYGSLYAEAPQGDPA